MKIKTAELKGAALDWAVAHASGMTLTGGKPASYNDVSGIPVPFSLFEVNHHFNNNDFSHCSISEIVVTRCGVNKLVGATAPSIDFTDEKGRKACGSIGDFFLSQDEAKKEVSLVESGGSFDLDTFKPSTDWAQGGTIIQREGIRLCLGSTGEWDAELCEFDVLEQGPTVLIAAMRCFVVSRLGEEVEVPDELINQ